LDFLPKKFEDIARDKQEAITLLQQRIKALSRRRMFMTTPRISTPTPAASGATLARSITSVTSSLRTQPVAEKYLQLQCITSVQVKAINWLLSEHQLVGLWHYKPY
jgi:hypothetical protein